MNLPLNHNLSGSNSKLPLDIGYPQTKIDVNRPKQTKVIEQKQKVDDQPPAHLLVRPTLQ